jgi:hypothetical protein
MENLKNIKGFVALNNFTLFKTIELVHGNGIKLSLKELPVLISVGAKLDEVFSLRSENSFGFQPHGMACVGEIITISKEELNHLSETKMIELFE